MKPEDLVQRVNRLKYPPTVYEQGWIYGMWYCGTDYRPADYWGKFPGTFLRRVRAMLGVCRLLHLCCGRCRIPGAVNVDMKPLPEVDVQANAENLPFKEGTFDAALIDPPYSEHDAQERYGVPRLIKSYTVLDEIRRVLAPGGWLLWLDEKYPAYRREDWQLTGLIGIVTGFERRSRLLALMRKLPLEDLPDRQPVMDQGLLWAVDK